MKRLRHVVLIPVGPTSRPAFVQDTIESVRHFTGDDRRIVIVDSCTDGQYPVPPGDDIDVFPSPFGPGLGAILHLGIAEAMRYSLDRYRFDVLLRMDDDALIVGPCPEEDAVARFTAQPAVGLLGSYTMTCLGHKRSFAAAARRLHRELDEGGITEPGDAEDHPDERLAVARCLRRLYRHAVARGYCDGEHCLGGAVYYRYEAVRTLRDAGMLGLRALRSSRLQDDHLFGLMARACGIGSGEFEQGEDPMCLDWGTLPCAPETIVDRGKKVIHSVKRWADMDQASIREFFRRQRALSLASSEEDSSSAGDAAETGTVVTGTPNP